MHRNRVAYTRGRRPFWLPASNYYILAAAFTIAFFFLLWGILQDGGERTPFIPAGIAAGLMLASAVLLREVILRSARNRFLASQRMLERNLSRVAPRTDAGQHAKLTLEQNAGILKEIKKRSDAAKVLSGFPEVHREVFDMCDEYLNVAARELPTVSPGSPRIAALRRGTETVTALHHFHLLKWAEMRSRFLASEAKSMTRTSQKLESVEEAVSVIGFALEHYPRDQYLLESEKVLHELVASIELSNLIEKAQRSEQRGNKKRALVHYRNALSHIRKTAKLGGGEPTEAIEAINKEVTRLSEGAQEKSG